MANIIDFFSKKLVQQEPTLRPTAKQLTWEDVVRAQQYDYSGSWQQGKSTITKLGVTLQDLHGHQVTLADVGKAISIAAVISKDPSAVEYFLDLSTRMTREQQYYVRLRAIPDVFKGYVWNSDFQIIINAAAFAEYQLGSIINEPITRHIFF